MTIKTERWSGPEPSPAAYDPIAPLDVMGMLRVLWHGKWVIAITTACAVLAGGYYAFKLAQPRYAATATLQIEVQPAHFGDVSAQWRGPATDLASLNTEVTVLTSDAILSRVIADQNLMQDPEFNRYLSPVAPMAISTLRGMLRQTITGIVQQPPDATAIAQKAVENLRGRLSAHRPRDTYLFQITAQSRDPAKAAAIANSAAAAYIAGQVEADDAASDAAILWLTGRVARLRTQLHRQETAVTDLIATVQIQEDKGLDVLSATVLAIDEERASLAATLAMFDGTDATSTRATAEAAQLERQIAEIDARRARLHSQLAAQSTGMVTLQQMQREADATRVLYQSFLSRLQETQVQRGLQHEDSRLVTPATEGRYAGPPKMLILTVASAVGALIGLLAVVMRQVTRKGALHPEDLRLQTGRPVLGQLSKAVLRNPKRMLQNGPKTAAALHPIKTGLMLLVGGPMPQVTLVSATTSGEGHITAGLALAQTMVSDHAKVLCIFTDPMMPEKTPFIAASPHAAPTFDPVMNCDVLRFDDGAGIIDAGLSDQLDQLRRDYAHIVIIAPPVATAPDARWLARHSDAVLFAVQWARTPVPAVQQAVAMLEEVSCAPIGLALTQTHLRKMRKLAALSSAPFAALELA